MKKNTLLKFHDIIVSIDSQNYEQTKQYEIYKCKITIIDGSNLRIFEKYDQSVLVYYSYYWLTPLNELIIGWDCAPHHPNIDSYPHHKHVAVQQKVVSTTERNLADVLRFIKNNVLI